MKQILTVDNIIKQCNHKHNNKYDYSNIIHVYGQLPIICPEHGLFTQLYVTHVNGGQCPQCKIIEQNTNLIQQCISRHKNKYDYSKVTCTGKKQNAKIICHEHGEFVQRIDHHIDGDGCPICKKRAYQKQRYIDILLQASIQHNNKYDYSKVTLVTNKETIICPEHGEFKLVFKNHMNGAECPLCREDRLRSKFLHTRHMMFAKVHGDKYDYSLSTFNEIINIVCKEHGIFKQRSNNHIAGSGCPQCAKSMSLQETELVNFVNTINYSDKILNSRKIIAPKELDIYIPEHQIAIEYNGLYWHSDEKKSSTYHLDKTNKCKEKGIRLIHIFEDEWINKQQIVKSRLSNIFNKTTNRIWARKCIIKDVTSSEAKQFLELNHIQGHAPGRHKIGLYYEDELVALMTFCNLRKSIGSKHVDGSYELLRYCNKLDHTVIGGASRLLKNFIKTNKPQQIISYSDKRWSVGNMYKQLGFVHVHDSPPNYFYIIDGQRKHRYGYRKDLLVAAGYDKAMTEREIMQSRGINRIYDSGASKWLLTLLN